jgi:hypothetical protein
MAESTPELSIHTSSTQAPELVVLQILPECRLAARWPCYTLPILAPHMGRLISFQNR